MGRFDPDFLVEDHRALRDAHLTDDQSGVVRYNPHVAVVTTAEGADDIAELRRVVRHPAIALSTVVASRRPVSRSIEELTVGDYDEMMDARELDYAELSGGLFQKVSQLPS